MSAPGADFLVELGTEEMPPRALRALEQAFAAQLVAGLDQAGLTHGPMQSFATPRRLAVRVRALAREQPEQEISRRGPPVSAAFDAAGAPKRAALAFAEGCGVKVDALERVTEPKGTFLFYRGRKPGAQARDLLPALVSAALDALPIPRRMRWGAGDAQFVRPAHWLVMLHGTEVVPARILDLDAGRTTCGHRFLAPQAIELRDPDEYEARLATEGRVRADFASRREFIRSGVVQLAGAVGGAALMDEGLLEEVTALTEWPVPLAGRFEPRFLELPREVLISTLQVHQRYFPVEQVGTAPARAGSTPPLLPAFITVSNIESRDPDRVREGNERVVRPRLADAEFFYAQDRQTPLAARSAQLDRVTFQIRLGSVGDKVRRMVSLGQGLAAACGADPGQVARAAALCKCDLVTGMVGEFPELQGIMGTNYARHDGEPDEVARAIGEHYQPRGAGDHLPATATGAALALADRFDTLAGIFAIGEKPSGTKDPFGLRRAAIGVLRILLERRIELDLAAVLGAAVALVRADLCRLEAARTAAAASQIPAEQLVDELYAYLLERLRAQYLEQEPSTVQEHAGGTAMPGAVPITAEMFDAVLATRPASPLDFDARLKALASFLAMPEASSLTAANKRIANILRKSTPAEGQGAASASTIVDASRLTEEAEIRLADALAGVREGVLAATAERSYAQALGRLAQLRPAVDAFFDQVLVMAEDPEVRANRILLLTQLHGLFSGIADLSRLPG